MLTNDEYRRMLGRPDISDAELNLFLADLRGFLSAFLDDYFQEEFLPD